MILKTPFFFVFLVFVVKMTAARLVPDATVASHLWFWGCLFLVSAVALGVTCIRLQFFGPVFCHGRRVVDAGEPKKVALTFDDGPDPLATPALLELLAKNNVHATFFCIGQAVEEHQALARQIAEQGHQLANHTHTHHWSINFSFAGRWQKEIENAQAAIVKATGQTPQFMRPPLGLTNPHVFGVLKKLGMRMAGWDVRSFDTLNKPVEKVITRVVKKTRQGSIILLHDGKQNPRRVCEITQGIIDALSAQGYKFVTLDEMTS